MNSSAKKSALSFLAAAALGAAAIMGCSVSTGSGTVDDTDGGTHNNDNKDKDAGSDKADTGTDTPQTCELPTQTSKVEPAACQTCLEQKCCLEMKNCYALPGDEAGGKVDCDGLKQCLDDCAKDPDTEKDCSKGCVDDLAAPGVKDAFASILTCQEQSCNAECL